MYRTEEGQTFSAKLETTAVRQRTVTELSQHAHLPLRKPIAALLGQAPLLSAAVRLGRNSHFDQTSNEALLCP